MKIVVVAHSKKVLGLISALSPNVSSVLYVLQPSIEIIEYCRKENVNLGKFSRTFRPNHDQIVLLLECKVILSEDQISSGKWINLHSGLLPKWRGLSANAWALLNEESFLGLTLHEVIGELDAGNSIYYVKTKNDYFSPLSVLQKELLRNLEKDILRIIERYNAGIHETQIAPYGKEVILYTANLGPEDGKILDFNVPSRFLFNLGRIFIHETHSDLYGKIDSNLIRIRKVEEYAYSYAGIPGKILKKEDGRMLVKTLDSAIWLSID